MELGESIKHKERQNEIALKLGEIMASYLDDVAPAPSSLPDNMTIGAFKDRIRTKLAEAMADIVAGHTLALIAVIRTTLNLKSEKLITQFVEHYAQDMLTMMLSAMEVDIDIDDDDDED